MKKLQQLASAATSVMITFIGMLLGFGEFENEAASASAGSFGA